MKLKTVYATLEEIPAGFEELYAERNGQYELVGIEGVKTQGDIDRLQTALTKERKDHRETREKFSSFADLDPTEVITKIENYDSLNEQFEALKAAGGGQLDEEKLEPILKARINQAIGPMEREKVQLNRKLEQASKLIADKDQEVGLLKTSITSGNIERAIRDAAVVAKVMTPAINDAVLRARGVFEIEEGTNKIITKDGVGVTPGLSPKEWFDAMQEDAPHWWPGSQGSGARGGGPPGSFAGADNPWSAEGWNITKQGQVVKELGAAKAAEIATRAGVKLGATKPKKAA